MANDTETVEQKFSEIRNYLEDEGIPTDKYKDLHRLVDEIEAAHKRELAAKDAEIDDLKAKNTEAFKAVLKRDALIKKLADALNNIRENTDYDVEYGCCGGWIITDDCFSQSSIDELVDKARDIISKMETTTEVTK